ncbi:hypothetical protein D8M04_15155 [Oceanobacillus piezotolerans]|uniref:YcaO domain-containing protein n=1 Tax=Oceanobacillus piezotolerans TaxID=2448030 RepID=A0A498D6U9_9BACI|nr:YcaO-like family protein [Oceanobacillus piezotolerans]RLL42884.1 hypothetical protein D8M04_15155 [Oceanobacillus piezotolerans]
MGGQVDSLPVLTNSIIPVSHNRKYIFVGPKDNGQHFCFDCMKERWKEVDLYSYYFSYGEDGPIYSYEKEIVARLKDKLELEQEVPRVYTFDRESYEIQVHGTFKRDDCSSCSQDRVDMSHKQKDGYFQKDNLRLESFDQVKHRLEKFKPMLFGQKAALINQLSRTGDSYGTPMVQSEVFYKGISMLSFGRTSTYGASKYTSVLESMERYATAFPYRSKGRKPLREEESEQIDLTLSEVMMLNNYKNDQGYKKDIPIYYSEAFALHKQENVLIPEQLIYYNSHQVTGEKRYIYESSNGSALGSTVEEASLHAILELLERDAFLATWYGQIPPVRIRVEEMESSSIDYYVKALRRKGIKVHIFEISVEVAIPIIWILLEKESPSEKDMAFYTAASASFDLKDAIEKALIEATTAISVFENLFKKPDYQKRKKLLLENPHSVTELEDHLLLYSNEEMKDIFSFALETPYHMNEQELENYYEDYSGRALEVLRTLEEKITNISPKTYRVAVENPNLTVSGFVNVKYIAPGMLTMTFGHQNKRVVYSRIEKAIQTKGRGRFDKDWIENIPHPFP